MSTIRIDAPKADLLQQSMGAYMVGPIDWLRGMLSAAGLGEHSTLTDIDEKYRRAQTQLSQRFENTNSKVVQCKVDIDLLPFLKRSLLYHRRQHVTAIQKKLENTTDLETIKRFDQSLASVDVCNHDDWFINTVPMKMPRLTDFCTLRYAEQLIKNRGMCDAMAGIDPPTRQYDDKFGVLWPPSAIAPSMAYWRQQCELRSLGLALAYFDIDNFKNLFNSYTETLVDRNCLPVILRAVEAHCFLHAEAFHVGGDEVIILMPNVEKADAIEFMDRLRLKLPTLTYIDVPSQARISVGLIHITSDSPFTDSEIEQKANDAKRFAKARGGKDCIVTFKGDRFTEDQLEVVRPIRGATEAP